MPIGTSACVPSSRHRWAGSTSMELQDAPLPLRLYYAGPVMRHEKPGRGRRRQFTQLGLELIGAAGAPAEAEVILAACDGLRALGIGGYKVVLGASRGDAGDAESSQPGHAGAQFRVEQPRKPGAAGPWAALRGSERLEESVPGGAEPVTPIHLPAGTRRQDARALLTGLLDRLDDDAALGGRRVDEIVESMLERFYAARSGAADPASARSGGAIAHPVGRARLRPCRPRPSCWRRAVSRRIRCATWRKSSPC